MRYREAKQLTQRYTAGQIKSQELNLGSPAPDPMHLTTLDYNAADILFLVTASLSHFLLFFSSPTMKMVGEIIALNVIKDLYFQFYILTCTSIKDYFKRKAYYLQLIQSVCNT